jgi:uncharacterized protein YbaR (Trm112 family)
MLDYLDVLNDKDWITKILVCPECYGTLIFIERQAAIECLNCGATFPIRGGIPQFLKPPNNKKEYLFEINRYNNIALKPPDTYYGLDESRPDVRTAIIKEYLDKVPLYLNIGQGFGQLEVAMGAKPKVCVDQCISFLNYCKSLEIPNTKYVASFAERMPFKSEYFPAVMSDSVFQTLVDQREFLIENARVLKQKGTFILAITYKWNYPRKPQDFPADNIQLLLLFLHELGIDAEANYINLEKNIETDYEEGDFLIVVGIKNR